MIVRKAFAKSFAKNGGPGKDDSATGQADVAGVSIATPASAAHTYVYRSGYNREIERRAYDNGHHE